jgi:6-phosphofructokinase 1
LKEEIERELGRHHLSLKIVKHLVGYELRCAPPSAWDIEYTRCLGRAAVEFLMEGGTDAIITLQLGNIVPIRYQDMINPTTGRTDVRMVDRNSFRYRSAYQFMTRLKPEHATDDQLIGKLAALTRATKEEFLERYGYLMK